MRARQYLFSQAIYKEREMIAGNLFYERIIYDLFTLQVYGNLLPGSNISIVRSFQIARSS